jgi:filamentous hemagglutinin family protein
MKKSLLFLFWLIKGYILFYLLAPLPTMAQLVPDSTLPKNSKITTQDNTSIINGGTRAGSNLFHSFDQFSIPTGSTAYFNNDINVQNIFSRVTGRSASSIDGLIKANGTANLFLLNPNGFIFGPNAQLNLGGSFLGSTAINLKFADGTEFSTTTPQSTPLLTVNVPIGLGFSSNPGQIRVQGSGHNLKSLGFLPITSSSSRGLQVQPGNTLALVGGDVVSEGGSLTAQGGQIELGSVSSGSVSINSTIKGWSLGYESVPAFKDIQLSQKSLLDANGFGSGSIQVQGAHVSLVNGSVILIQNQGIQPSGSLKVNASESLELSGVSSDGSISSILRTEAVGSGNGGDIVISTKNLVVQEGAAIAARTYSSAIGGNVDIKVLDSTKVLGFSSFNPLVASNISTRTSATGSAGKITISTGRLAAVNGGFVASTTLGTGAGGNVSVNATDSVELFNTDSSIAVGSDLAATTFNAGNAGSLTINTSRLIVGDGTAVNSSTVGSGSSNSVTINAPGFVEIIGTGTVSSSAVTANTATQRLFGSPPAPSGFSGKVIINTGRLSLTDGGTASVRNEGLGDAGSLTVNAGSINLDNQSSITAATTSGEGGNIFLRSQNLQLKNNSFITAAAGGSGSGGNIDIDTDTLAALENSSIIANAFEGRGGNITINTQGLFFSPDSTIDASSKLGIDGIVQINSPYLELSKAAASTPSEPENPKVASVCRGESGKAASSLVNAGTGGIPASPSDPLSSSSGWHDNSISTQESSNSQEFAPSTEAKPVQELVEAQGWKWNPDGTLSTTLEPEPGGVVPYGSLTTPPCQQATQAPRASHSK